MVRYQAKVSRGRLESELVKAKRHLVEFGQELLRERAEREYLEGLVTSIMLELDAQGFELIIPPRE